MSGKEEHEESLFASTGATNGELFKSKIVEWYAMEMNFHTPEGTRMMIKLFFESELFKLAV